MIKKILLLSLFLLNSLTNPLISDEISSRRSYLNWHQGLGLATWGTWLATNIAGEQKYKEEHGYFELRDKLPNQILTSYLIQPSNDKLLLYYAIKNFEEEGHSSHGQLGALTFVLYSATASMAFLSPGRLNDVPEEGWTTMFTHKSMIFIHLPAMISLAYLGSNLEEARDLENMRNIGWAGFSALTVSLATFYF